jgi:hypothetical protein
MSRPVTSNSKKNRTRRDEYSKEKTLDQLAEFEEFKAVVLPQLQELLTAGATSKEMRERLAPLMTARVISIALTEQDSNKALAAIKDQLDRQEGKAKERTETTHKFEHTKEEELDAILLSKLADLAPVATDDTEH